MVHAELVIVAAVSRCPSCPPALEARHLVFSEAFWLYLGYAALPFVIAWLAAHQLAKRIDRDSNHR